VVVRVPRRDLGQAPDPAFIRGQAGADPRGHRLAQYRAGRRLDYAAADPEYLAQAIATEIDRPVDHRPVETGGASRAAALLAELL
jgi:hypothetical protein